MFRLAALAIFALSFSAAQAEERLTLTMPLDCKFGEDCIVQHYVDADPRLGAVDYECGGLAYDGHEGTDFRLLDAAELKLGFKAIAAAPGTVRAVVGNLPDGNFRIDRSKPLSCGNAVVVDHGAGWTTQYCHLAFASPMVSVGQTVERGQPLGIIGSSGSTNFPHLHFAVRKFGIVVDPYTGVSPTGCKKERAGSMWHPSTGIAYVGSALMGFGVTGVFPSVDAVSDDHDHLTLPVGTTNPVYLWAQMLGTRPGDSFRLILLGPGGLRVADERFEMEQHISVNVLNIGVTPADIGRREWPAGTYRAMMEFYGDGELLQAEKVDFSLPGGPLRASAAETVVDDVDKTAKVTP